MILGIRHTTCRRKRLPQWDLSNTYAALITYRQTTASHSRQCYTTLHQTSNMNSPNIDIKKVQAAVARYAPKRVVVTQERKAAVDSALRKPLKGPSRSCSGLSHPHFINNQ